MTSEDQLKQLPEDMRDIRNGRTGETYNGCPEADVALDLAIRIAEAIAANPRGFLNWAKTTGFEI